MHRIQVLVWFLCAVMLQTNHGLLITPLASRNNARRKPNMLSYFPPRARTYVYLEEKETILSSSTCLDDKATFQDSFSKFLLFLSCGLVGMWPIMRRKRRSSLSNKPPTLLQSTLFRSISFPFILIVASTLIFTLQATLITVVSFFPILTHMVATTMRQTASWYLLQLDSYPIVTKSLTAGVISWIGDYAAQMIAHRLKQTRRQPAITKPRYHVRRGLASLMDGMLISGPVMHWSYDWLERMVPAQASHAAVMIHVVADSLVLDSLFVATEIIGTGIMEGYQFHREVLPQLKRDYVDTLKAGWATSVALIPIEYVCFRCFPVTLRTVVMNLADVVWDGMVSFMAHRNRPAIHE